MRSTLPVTLLLTFPSHLVRMKPPPSMHPLLPPISQNRTSHAINTPITQFWWVMATGTTIPTSTYATIFHGLVSSEYNFVVILQALAYNPNNNTENMTVSFDLRCHGGDDDGNGVRSVNPVVFFRRCVSSSFLLYQEYCDGVRAFPSRLGIVAWPHRWHKLWRRPHAGIHSCVTTQWRRPLWFP